MDDIIERIVSSSTPSCVTLREDELTDLGIDEDCLGNIEIDEDCLGIHEIDEALATLGTLEVEDSELNQLLMDLRGSL